jgi:hypothetical protein
MLSRTIQRVSEKGKLAQTNLQRSQESGTRVFAGFIKLHLTSLDGLIPVIVHDYLPHLIADHADGSTR